MSDIIELDSYSEKDVLHWCLNKYVEDMEAKIAQNKEQYEALGLDLKEVGGCFEVWDKNLKAANDLLEKLHEVLYND
jgi:hypothetical protein